MNTRRKNPLEIRGITGTTRAGWIREGWGSIREYENFLHHHNLARKKAGITPTHSSKHSHKDQHAQQYHRDADCQSKHFPVPDPPYIGTLRVQPECNKGKDHNKRQDEDKVVEDEIGQPFGKRVVRAHEPEDRKINPAGTR